MKNKNKMMNTLSKTLKLGAAFERLSFFVLVLLLLCHFVGCLWIFVGRTIGEGESWIEAGGFEDNSIMNLYAVSTYFTMTTITTVGYGDISGTTTVEKVICIFLHLIGVISYSFATGSLTSIIANYDSMNDKNQEKIDTLNRLYKDNQLPPELYYKLLTSIKNNDNSKERAEIIDFLEDLPFRLKVRTILEIYKDAYEKIYYLKN